MKNETKTTAAENITEQQQIELCPPWVEYFNKLECMFGADPDIKLMQNFDDQEIKMYVNGTDKAAALEKLLPDEIRFGTSVWHLIVVPANTAEDVVDLLDMALKGNPNYCGVAGSHEVIERPFTYLMFRKKVAQYYNDDLGDPNGYRSLLYADLAKELFQTDYPGLRFCTSVESSIG